MQVSRKAVGLTLAVLLALAATIGGICTLPSRAQEPPAAGAGTPSPATMTMGDAKPAEAHSYLCQVVDRLTKQPIAGASVTVQRRISSRSEPFASWQKLGEAQHQTDAEGQYTVTIPADEAAQSRLYIEITAKHRDYLRYYGGYSFAMILKNEKLGERPFFESVALQPAERISGTVVTPEGKPAAGVPVKAFSTPAKDDFEHSSWSDVTTDAEGGFELNMATGGEGIFWILPDDCAPSTHVVHGQRGNLGRFALDKGLVLKGRVVDVDGKPLPNVWVNAEIRGGAAKQAIDLPVYDHLMRAALSGATGEFAMAPPARRRL